MFNQLYNKLKQSLQTIIENYALSRSTALEQGLFVSRNFEQFQNPKQFQAAIDQYNQTLAAQKQAEQEEKIQNASWISNAWNTTARVTTSLFHTADEPISSDRAQQLYFLVRCLQQLEAVSRCKTATIKTKNNLAQQILNGLATLLIATKPCTIQIGSETFELPPFETASHLTSRIAASASQAVGYTNGANVCRSRLGGLILQHVFSGDVEAKKSEFQTAYTTTLEEQAGVSHTTASSKEKTRQQLHQFVDELVDSGNHELIAQMQAFMQQHYTATVQPKR
jgi:hypothetical protein